MYFTTDMPFRADGVDMKAAPGTLVNLSANVRAQIASLAGRFIPQFCYLGLRTLTGGALTTSPGLRVGTNATHDNVCPIFIPPTSLVIGQIGSFPLKVPLIAPPLDTTDLFLELTQTAVGPSTMTADILLIGLLVG
jgi:hypothetical protein